MRIDLGRKIIRRAFKDGSIKSNKIKKNMNILKSSKRKREVERKKLERVREIISSRVSFNYRLD